MDFMRWLQGPDFMWTLNSPLILFLICAVINSAYLANCILLMHILFKPQMESKKRILFFVPVIAVLSLLDNWWQDNYVVDLIVDAVIMAAPYAETRILFKKVPFRKIIATVLSYSIAVDFPAEILKTTDWGRDKGDIINLSINALYFIVILFSYLVYYRKRKVSEKLSYLSNATFSWIGVTVVCFSLTFIELVTNADFSYPWLIPIDILLLILVFPYIVYSLLKAKQSENYFRKALDAEIRQFEIINEKDEDLRRFRHDYANHMRCICALIEDGQADDIKAYVEKIGVALQNTTRDFYSGNYMLDTILAEKRSAARQDGNDLLFEGSFPKSGIKNDDICTIMANALDNAVEACREIKERCEIVVKSIVKEDRVTVSVTNPVESKVHLIGNSVATSKPDKSRHGYGLKSIKKAVEKYDGNIHLSSDHRTFELIFSLKLK